MFGTFNAYMLYTHDNCRYQAQKVTQLFAYPRQPFNHSSRYLHSHGLNSMQSEDATLPCKYARTTNACVVSYPGDPADMFHARKSAFRCKALTAFPFVIYFYL